MTVIKDVDIDMVAAIDARTAYTTGTNLFAGDIPPVGGTVEQIAIGVKQITAPPSQRMIRGNSTLGELHGPVLFVVTARGTARSPKSARDAVVDVIEALHCAPPSGYLHVEMAGAPFDLPATDGALDVPYATAEGFATYEE